MCPENQDPEGTRSHPARNRMYMHVQTVTAAFPQLLKAM